MSLEFVLLLQVVTIVAIVAIMFLAGPRGDSKLREELAKVREEKEHAYLERNMVVSLYVKTLYENGLVKPGGYTVGTGATPGFGKWKTCVYIDTPTIGQISWHFHDRHAYMLRGMNLPRYAGKWDGRSSGEKYDAIRDHISGA